MAIVASDPNLQNQQQQQQNQQAQTPGTSQQSGGVQTTSSSSAQEASPQQKSPVAPKAGQNPADQYAATHQADPKSTSSGRFQNLQGYLKANANFNQGQGLAGQIGGTLGSKEQQQEQQFGSEAQRVQQQAQQEGSVFDPNASKQFLGQAFADPTQVANDATKLAQFQKLYQGQVNAPTAYDAAGNLGQANQQFQQQAGLAGTESGRATLLNQLYGKPSYNTGQQNLDQLLLQGQPGQLGKLQSTAQDLTGKLGQAYQQGQTSSNQAISDLQANAAAASQAAKTQYGQTVASSQADLQKRAADLQAQRNAQVSQAQTALASGQLSPEMLGQLGLSHGTNIYDLDLTKYLQNNAGTVGVGNVANAADQAKFQALSKLTGGTDQQLANYANPASQLGSAVGFNTAGLTNDASQRAAAYQQAVAGLKAQDQAQIKANQAEQAKNGGSIFSTIGDTNFYKQGLQKLMNQYGVNKVI